MPIADCRDAGNAEINDFPFAADLPSLTAFAEATAVKKLWQGRVAGKGKPLSPAFGGTGKSFGE
jgi:hypothetical protein